jgi:hypothetical protein
VTAEAKDRSETESGDVARPAISNWRVILVIALILAAGVGLRLYDPEADAPAFFADGSQDFTTDGGYLTLFAKNKVDFGQWDLFEYTHWETFKVSVISAVGLIAYTMLGVSVGTGTVIGVLLGAVGLFLFLLVLARRLSPYTTTIATLLLSLNFVLILYNRFPFSENALLVGAGIYLFVMLQLPDKPISAIAAGLLVAFIAFFTKAFGLLLIIPPIVWWLSQNTDGKWRLSLTAIATACISLVALSYLIHGKFELVSFLWTHGTEGHGFPHGLELPFGPFENLFSFARTGLHKYTPFLSIGCGFALLWSIFYREPDAQLRKLQNYSWSWLIGWIVVLSVFNYRPLRYQYVLVVPIVILVTHWLGRAPAMVRRHSTVRWWQAPSVLALGWYFVYHAVTPFAIDSLSLRAYYRWVWYLLPVGFALTGVVLLLFRRPVSVSPVFVRMAAFIVVIGSLAVDGYLYYDWYSKRTYGIRDANRDLAGILGPDAVVSGQVGPAVTCGNDLRAFPLFIKLPFEENLPLLREYPITHLAVPVNLWRNLKKSEPIFDSVPVVARFWIRDNINYVVPVYNLFGNETAMKYQPTDFEKAARVMAFGGNRPPDSLMRRTLQSQPDNRTALIYLYHWLAHTGRISECAPIVDTLLENYPTDFVVNLLAAIYYRTMSGLTGDQTTLSTAARYLELAVRYNPRSEEVLRNKYNTSTADMFII